jgi:membrane-bound ClpP family serine protease
MMIIVVLAVAVLSIGLFLMAVTLPSRSIAALNFMICLVAGAVIQPWSTFALHPPANEDDRLYWIAAMIWTLIFSASVIGGIYCLFVTRQQKPLKRGKRRRRSRSSRDSNE